MSAPQGKGRGGRKPRMKREKPEFDQQILDLARVTRVTKGGKQMSFRACVVIGDRKGRVGFGLEKGKDVQIAVEKAVNHAKKNLIHVPLVKETIPHRVDAKFKAGRVMIKPAPRGSGIIAGSSLRVVLELAGVPNASGKVMGKTNNKVTNLKATIEALKSFNKNAVAAAKAATPKREKTVSVVDKEEPVEKKKKLAKTKVAPKKDATKTGEK